jgi:hypothetical protein
MSNPMYKRCKIVPVPPLETHTRRFDAGPIQFGVEYRSFTDEVILGNYEGDEESQALVRKNHDEWGHFRDEGVSIHVFDGRTSTELLRFDCFPQGAHYHYIYPSTGELDIVPYDSLANGDMRTWVMTTLADKLPALLEAVGATDLVHVIDMDHVRTVLRDQVEVASIGAREQYLRVNAAAAG